MLWSLVKILVFVLLVAALSYGATVLMETGPGLRVAVGEVEFVLGPLQAVIVALILFAAVWIVLKIAGLLVAVLRFLNGDETAISRYFSRSRERRGFQALADGMIALASGEARLAMSNATKAERYLRRPELTNILAAQAAEMLGDKKRATETYKKMVTIDQTRFVGVCGLMKQKLAEGDTETAMKLAEKAFALKPRHGETQDTLLRLQAQAEDWKGARATLNAKLRHGNLPRDVHKRRDAVLALCEARDCAVDGNAAKSHELALEANRLSPDLVPAAVMAARAYVEQGKPNLASRLLKRAWEAQPHPDLAAGFAAIVRDETPQERLQRFAELTALRADDRETRMLLAELNIAAEDFNEARRALGDLPETEPTVRVLALMAAIERGLGAEDSVVRGYLASALGAPGGQQWICDNCGTIHDEWRPLCSKCGAFDAITWKSAPTAPLTLPGGANMLPLLVGTSGEGQNG
ncbi:HemY protein [Rhodovulum bhavnagarense]|uniref:HemY protein n=1 Tax=Rhodovulum bhavnagarense TaxID=992286 RepID=A0A4R2RPP9_9RHOB|nr:heme biosynthesis HemY N-terminal domain-containing protein [Rhodovulum bhavnagarense]TCP61165.1 HemY protein [Rhodovulum bhavnagarense]